MFCGKCGAQNQENAIFCKDCGAPLNQVPSANSGVGAVWPEQSTGKKNRKIGIVAVATVVLVVIMIFVGIFGGRSYKSVVKKFIEASFTADGKEMVSLIPDEVMKVACEDGDMTKSEFIESLTEDLEYQTDYLDDYYDECSYEIIEVEDYSSKALKSLQEDYEDEFDVDVKAAKTVTVEITITVDKDDEFSNSLEIGVIQVGHSWYVDVFKVF